MLMRCAFVSPWYIWCNVVGRYRSLGYMTMLIGSYQLILAIRAVFLGQPVQRHMAVAISLHHLADFFLLSGFDQLSLLPITSMHFQLVAGVTLAVVVGLSLRTQVKTAKAE